MKKYTLSSSGQINEVTCPHCHEENPKSAYRCLSCHEIMFPKTKPPLWNANIRPSVAFLIILVALLWAGYAIMKNWLAAVEANMTLHVRTDEYNVSIVADKKKGTTDVQSQIKKEPAPPDPLDPQ
jgi:hypothetical protein